MRFLILLSLLLSVNAYAGVTNGQPVNAATTNAAFMDKNANTYTSGTAAIKGGQLSVGVLNTTAGNILLYGSTSGTVTVGTTSAAGTYNFNLPTTAGTSGYLLTSGGGAAAPMTWSAAGAPTFATRSVTTTDACTNADNVLLLSGTSFTETLFTAVGNAGKILIINHVGTSETNLYTLNTTSSQTIGGIASGAYVLHDNGESLMIVSDGTNWQILNHRAITAWTAWTPTFTGFGTAASINYRSRRVGSNLEVNGNFVSGNTTGVTAKVSVGYGGTDGNVTIDSTVTGGVIGNMNVAGASATTFGWYVLAPTTNVDYVNMSVQSSTLNDTTPANGSALVGNSQGVLMQFSVPIVGWQP